MARAIECQCGEYIAAQNDTALQEALSSHAAEDHPDWTAAEMKAYLAKNTYDLAATEV